MSVLTVVGLAGLVLAWIGLGALGRLVWQLTAQNGRSLLRIEALEHQLAPSSVEDEDLAIGLPPGSVLNDFELPLLGEGTMTLSQWRGRQVLLIFFHPGCAYCWQLLADLTALVPDPPPGRPVPLIVSTGDPAENRRLVEQYRIAVPVLLQEDSELAALYRVPGTPMAYVIDERGATLGPLALGAEAILARARGEQPRSVDGSPRADDLSQASVSQSFADTLGVSRVNRAGLPLGTVAPDFQLPTLNGGEITLASFRGRELVLIFVDPFSPPVDELLPRLKELSRQFPELALVLIGRGDLEENRRLVAEHDVTFPVALQRRWEISLAYGTLAAPVAYQIDAAGYLTAGPAFGGAAILRLALAASTPTTEPSLTS